MLKTKSKPSIQITQLLTSIDSDETQARALIPYASIDDCRRRRHIAKEHGVKKKLKKHKRSKKPEQVEDDSKLCLPKVPTPRAALRRDVSLSFGPVRQDSVDQCDDQGRPTLTERELSKTIAWRRKQFYLDSSTEQTLRPDPQILAPASSSDQPASRGRSESSSTPKTIASMPTSTTMALSSGDGGKVGSRPHKKLQIDFATSVSLGGTNEPPGATSNTTGPCIDYLPGPSSIYDEENRRRSTVAESRTSGHTAKRSVFLKIRRPLTTDQTYLQALSEGDDIFDTIEIPAIRKWLGPSDLHYAFLKCIPLAAACLLLSLLFLAWGVTNIITACVQDGITWEETGDIVVGIFKMLIGVAGVVTVVFKLKMGLHFLCVGYNVFLVSQTVSFITQWLEWGLALQGATTADGQPWHPTKAEKAYMIWHVFQLTLIIAASFLFIIGTLSSMKMVVACGGTGWEKKTYLEILEEQEFQRRANYDLELGCPTEYTENGSHLDDPDNKKKSATFSPDLALT